MKPIIAISGAVDNELTITLQNTYTNAIECAGGLPLIIPYTENEESLKSYIDLCDGILFTGGGDIEPKLFGEGKKDFCTNVQKSRDKLELALFKKFFEQKKPIMGICRGAQLINVGLGGTLYQDKPTEIPSEIRHTQIEPKNIPSHTVKILSDTPLMELIGKEKMTANSFHHQAIKALGDGLSVMALADDGIIEAIYYTGKNYISAYQWHPERLIDKDCDNLKLFESFINVCSESKNSANDYKTE